MNPKFKTTQVIHKRIKSEALPKQHPLTWTYLQFLQTTRTQCSAAAPLFIARLLFRARPGAVLPFAL